MSGTRYRDEGKAIVEQRRSRRQLLRRTAGAILGAILVGSRGRAAQATTQETCFWRREQAVCTNGQAVEYWCYFCCAGPSCEVVYCEWRVVGRC